MKQDSSLLLHDQSPRRVATPALYVAISVFNLIPNTQCSASADILFNKAVDNKNGSTSAVFYNQSKQGFESLRGKG